MSAAGHGARPAFLFFLFVPFLNFLSNFFFVRFISTCFMVLLIRETVCFDIVFPKFIADAQKLNFSPHTYPYCSASLAPDRKQASLFAVHVAPCFSHLCDLWAMLPFNGPEARRRPLLRGRAGPRRAARVPSGLRWATTQGS